MANGVVKFLIFEPHPGCAHTTRLGRTTALLGMTAQGHEEPFPPAKAECRLWVQKGDDPRNTPQWARRADTGCSPRWGATDRFDNIAGLRRAEHIIRDAAG